MSFNIKINGLDELQKRFRKLGDAVQAEVAKKATGRGTAIIRDEAQKNVYKAPKSYRVYNSDGKGGKTCTVVKPGHVGRSVIMKRIPASERHGLTSKHIVTISNSKEIPKGAKQIAAFIEYGINMPRPHPFMRPAFDNKKEEAKNAATDILKKEVRKQWKK
ncbi:HK97-gp10 family putative phage morphogenesis protein [Snodgrassella communis]|uniref:HK97-gp10 family putative phage morphogenesis protein n=1 Tax=Snodgrassella communis TaxID=2946699 RepID=UPI00286B308A|nr:HK97-gp10 family putative phage morphogenesis protein [Snodgrassella communis]WMY91882.1 HK97 gp10 family phage protein [Snodgrassella communis]